MPIPLPTLGHAQIDADQKLSAENPHRQPAPLLLRDELPPSLAPLFLRLRHAASIGDLMAIAKRCSCDGYGFTSKLKIEKRRCSAKIDLGQANCKDASPGERCPRMPLMPDLVGVKANVSKQACDYQKSRQTSETQHFSTELRGKHRPEESAGHREIFCAEKDPSYYHGDECHTASHQCRKTIPICLSKRTMRAEQQPMVAAPCGVRPTRPMPQAPQ